MSSGLKCSCKGNNFHTYSKREIISTPFSRMEMVITFIKKKLDDHFSVFLHASCNLTGTLIYCDIFVSAAVYRGISSCSYNQPEKIFTPEQLAACYQKLVCCKSQSRAMCDFTESFTDDQ